MARPQSLSVVPNSPHAIVKNAGGILVDLDPARVEWTTKGKDEQVTVFLENVDSQTRTEKRSLNSNVHSVDFDVHDMKRVATSREYRGSNRIRAVVEWSDGNAVSDVANVAVGINVELALFGTVVGDTPDRTIHTLLATIDQSNERLPADYCFSGNFVCYIRGHPTVVPLRSCNNDTEVKIPDLDKVDWSKPTGFTYNGPDDAKIVRTTVSGQPRS